MFFVYKTIVANVVLGRNVRKHSLSLKLLIATWAVSSFATLIFTAVQLAMDYQRDFEKLKNNFSIVQEAYLPSLAENLWSYDTRMLQIQLDGLSRIPGISYLHLKAEGKDLYRYGRSRATADNSSRFSVRHRQTNEVLGILDVELDVASLQQRYISEAIWIFIRQAFKTALVVLCLFFIFNRILVVHIEQIANFLKEHRGRREEIMLKLKRPLNHSEDELDILVDSINLFRMELMAANTQLEKMNHALEEKVSERTRQLTIKNDSLEKAVQQIKRMQSSLVAQEKLASLGSLTASVAHEIRNPLNFVLNFSELLTDADDLTEVAEISRVILKHSQRIDQIVRSMQILSGHDNDTLENVDINEILKKSYQETLSNRTLRSSYIPPKVTYRLGQLPLTHVYANSLQRAFANIIDNSIHALEKKSLQQSDFESELFLTTSTKSEFIEISIKDNGIGIQTLLGEKIYDPFMTTKGAGEGAGLGLTVAYNIAQKHGGSLRYVSEYGQWTEFTMTIPIYQEPQTVS